MTTTPVPNLISGVVNQILAIKPLWNFAKGRARTMMVKRAETIGVPWRETVQQLQTRQSGQDFDTAWYIELETIQNPELVYPDYYTTSFHAYDEGNLGWRPAMEVEVAAKAVHARIWPEAGATGDARLRQSYHDVLKAKLPEAPKDIVDLGCGVGMSTETLQATFPTARLTGVDLSPYFLAVAKYREQESQRGRELGEEGSGELGSQEAGEQVFRDNRDVYPQPATATTSLPLSPSSRPPSLTTWHHAPAEATGLPDSSYNLVSICLVFHELPQSAAKAMIQEAHRLLRPGGHLAIMDMNPQSEVLQKMPAFVFTLLKSTEPYLDEYFTLNLDEAFCEAGFEPPSIDFNSPRHRTIIGQKPKS
jgi:ubiquinone/menaquinone biosynthesis C-methylase UbiE